MRRVILALLLLGFTAACVTPGGPKDTQKYRDHRLCFVECSKKYDERGMWVNSSRADCVNVMDLTENGLEAVRQCVCTCRVTISAGIVEEHCFAYVGD